VAGETVLAVGRGRAKLDTFVEAAELGYRLVVATGKPPRNEAPYIKGYVPWNGGLTREALDPVVEFCRREGVAGVFPVGEPHVGAAAAIAERLGLPCPGAAAARRARNKYDMKRCLAAAGIPVARCRRVDSLSSAERAGRDLGYPMVLKPQVSWGSNAVVRVDGPADLEGALGAVSGLSRRKHGLKSVLAEEYLPGRELSLEGVVFGEQPEIVALTDKPQPMEGPYFPELVHIMPSRLPADMQRRMIELGRRAVTALRLRDCAFHCEIRVCGDRLWVLEIAARLAGNYIPVLYRLATGRSLVGLMLEAVLGRTGRVGREWRGAAGVRFLVPQRAGRFTGVRGLEEIRSWPGVVRAELMRDLGDEMRLPPEEYKIYLGHVIAIGANPSVVERLLAGAVARADVEISAAHE